MRNKLTQGLEDTTTAGTYKLTDLFRVISMLKGFVSKNQSISEGHMTGQGYRSPLGRRSFLTRLGAGVTALSATAATGTVAAEAQSVTEGRWLASRHEQDDWMDKVPGRHRFIFDTIAPDAFGMALLFSNNYFVASQDGYGLQNSDLAVIIVARHNSTPFAFNDAMWAKYGAPIAQRAGFSDPKTKQTPTTNLYNASDYGPALANRGNTLDSMLKRGVQLAVCKVATRGYAGAIAMATGGNTDTVFNELTANLVSNSHLVPAGIVAVNRAQERGYSFVHA